MIAQVPQARQYRKRHLESVPQMLRLINEVLTMAPEFSEDAMVMLPLGAILDWTMGTRAGFAAFRDPRINAVLKKVLTACCEFLSSGDSRYVLNDSPSGWKCAAARRAVGVEQYQYEPNEEYWGFAPWNDFFTRRFKNGARPGAPVARCRAFKRRPGRVMAKGLFSERRGRILDGSAVVEPAAIAGWLVSALQLRVIAAIPRYPTS